MIKLTKSIELTLADILSAIDSLNQYELKIVIRHLTDEKTGIALKHYKNISTTIDLEKMISERAYKGVDWQKVDVLVNEMNVKEPMEMLLKQLSE